MVKCVRFVISEDLVSGPETSLAAQGSCVGEFLLQWKETEKTSDIDFRMGWRVPYSLVFSKGIIYFLISYYNKSKECLKFVKILPDPLPQFTF